MTAHTPTPAPEGNPRRDEASRAEHSRAEQDRAEQDRAQQGRAEQNGALFPLRGFLWLSGLALVLMAVLPDDAKGVVYLVFAVFVITVSALRCSRLSAPVRRPTALIVAAGALSLAAGVTRSVHSILTGTEYPYPSPAEALIFLAYLLFLAAILIIVRRRHPHLGTDPILDALVGGGAAALVQWTLVIIPYVGDPATTVAARTVTVAYAALAVMLVVAAVLALVSGSVPTPSNRLLAAGLVATFAMDVMADLVADQKLAPDLLLFTSWLILVLGGAGLLHPSVTSLLDRPTGAVAMRRLSNRRIAVLSVALLTPPALLLWEVWRGADGVEIWLPAVGAAVLAPLVLVRLGRLVRQNEQMTAMEVSLRSVGERLVATETAAEVSGVISVGLEQVLGDRFAQGGLVLDPARDARRGSGMDLEPAVRSVLDAARSAAPVTGDLREVATELPGHWHAGPVVVQRRLRGVVAVVTTEEMNDAERNAVVALCREAAIALRAVERTELSVRQRSEERFASLVDNSSDIVAILDEHLGFGYVSPVAERLLGHGLVGRRLTDVLHPEDRAAAEQMLVDVRFGAQTPHDLRMGHADGRYLWFEVSAVDLHSDPNIGGIVLNAREIGDRKVAEEQLQLSEARFKALVQHSNDLVVVVDSRERIRYASPAAARIIGEDPEGLLGRPPGGVFRGSDLDWESALRTNIEDGGHPVPLEFGFRNAHGDWIQLEAMVTDLRSEPSVGGFVLNARDVTERKRMMQHLRYQATHDPLTGMANRVLAVEELDGMLGRNAGSSTVAVVSIDIDDFKDVNDSLGHGVGDRLIVAAADRIRESLAFGDVAARAGGDEFVIVMERAHGEQTILELASALLRALERPFTIEDRELSITASAGVAYDHDRVEDAESLLRNADTAMYRAKQQGKRRVVVFEPHMRTVSFDRLELRADMAAAIETEQFTVQYQPILDIFSGHIVGAEALLRWDHPRRGRLSPALFIPLAEELGLIRRLGRWVLRRACWDLARWSDELPGVGDSLTVAVNLSAQDLHDDSLVQDVSAVMSDSGLAANRLVLEVTESNLLDDTSAVRDRIAAIRSTGTRLAIDDFGTGYSSLGYVQRYDFDVIKIDRSFVESLVDGTNRRIVAAVLDLASQLGVEVVAEGIEEEAQEHVLKELGCRFGQGFLYSRPVSEEAFRRLLSSWVPAGGGR